MAIGAEPPDTGCFIPIFFFLIQCLLSHSLFSSIFFSRVRCYWIVGSEFLLPAYFFPLRCGCVWLWCLKLRPLCFHKKLATSKRTWSLRHQELKHDFQRQNYSCLITLFIKVTPTSWMFDTSFESLHNFRFEFARTWRGAQVFKSCPRKLMYLVTFAFLRKTSLKFWT